MCNLQHTEANHQLEQLLEKRSKTTAGNQGSAPFGLRTENAQWETNTYFLQKRNYLTMILELLSNVGSRALEQCPGGLWGHQTPPALGDPSLAGGWTG